jgi:hypothetical protein
MHAAGAQTPVVTEPAQSPTKHATKELLTEAAIIAAIIAASIAEYKAMGKPCACPEDTMRNGRRCGGVSAWSRPGGYKPLCYLADVTAPMIASYRATNKIPPLK